MRQSRFDILALVLVWTAAFTLFVFAVRGCDDPEPVSPPQTDWNPKPEILSHARKVHYKLDTMDLVWDSKSLEGTDRETWTLEGSYKDGWLETSWTVDPINQTVKLDWSKLTPLPK